MMTLNLYAVQLFSRPVSREDYIIPNATLTTKEGRQLEGYLKIQFGSPLMVGAAEGAKVRPNYAQPWETREGPSIGAVQWVDPYAEIRWPSWALASFNANVTPTELDTAAECDILERMRTLISFKIFELPELKVMADQLLSHDGYRYGYWTQCLDFFRNPIPAQGKYANADKGEPVGPGHVSLFGIEVGKRGGKLHSLALVWSQAFSFPNRTNAQADDEKIRKRAKKIKLHYNAKDELARVQDDLNRRDVKGCIRSAAAAVEAAIKYCCAEWGVNFPRKEGLSFDEKIELILQMAGRPSYRDVDAPGLRELRHLYRSRNSIHEGDCYYHDDTLGDDVYCDMSHADRFYRTAQAITFWLDSQA